VKEGAGNRTLWILWWIGLLCGGVAQLHFTPDQLVWASVLMLPLSSCAVTMLCIDILLAVLLEFETYLVIALQLALAAAATLLLRDVRVVFWVCHLPNMTLSPFLDAYPSRYRAKFLRRFIFGSAMVIICWNLMLLCGWCKPLHDDMWRVGNLQGFPASGLLSTCGTLLFFYCRHFYAAVFRPNEFVIILTSVQTAVVQVQKVSNAEGPVLVESLELNSACSKHLGESVTKEFGELDLPSSVRKSRRESTLAGLRAEERSRAPSRCGLMEDKLETKAQSPNQVFFI